MAENSNEGPPDPSRRRFLKQAGVVAGGLLGAVALEKFLPLKSPQTNPPEYTTTQDIQALTQDFDTMVNGLTGQGVTGRKNAHFFEMPVDYQTYTFGTDAQGIRTIQTVNASQNLREVISINGLDVRRTYIPLSSGEHVPLELKGGALNAKEITAIREKLSAAYKTAKTLHDLERSKPETPLKPINTDQDNKT